MPCDYHLYCSYMRVLYKIVKDHGQRSPSCLYRLERRSVALDVQGRKAMSLFAYHADLTWLEQPMHLVDDHLPVFFAGDALREPFWPRGEGCSRGFLGAFDTIWALRSWALGLEGKALLRLRKQLFDLASQAACQYSSHWVACHESGQVDPAKYGKGVLRAHSQPVPWMGLEFLSCSAGLKALETTLDAPKLGLDA